MVQTLSLADGSAILVFDFFFLGQTREPFRGGLQSVRQAIDNHAAVGIDPVRFIPLDGGFVDPHPPPKLRHGDTDFVSALFNTFTDLFWREHFCVIQEVHLLSSMGITQLDLNCNPKGPAGSAGTPQGDGAEPGVGSTYRGRLHERLTQTAKSTAQPLGHAVRT